MKLIQRNEYLEQLKMWQDKEIIKVVTGIRRCGKSTLLDLYIEYLHKNGVEENQIVRLNLEEKENQELLDENKLYDFLKSKMIIGKMTYYFIDEVQMCNGFERVVDSLFVKQNTDVYITGSNAYMLSSELATLLTGRYIEISMLPLSFVEYTEAVTTPDKRDRFADFMNLGSFPFATSLIENYLAHTQYIEGVYNTVVVKDILKRKGITDSSLVKDVTRFLCSNIGSSVSAKKIADYLTSNGRPVGSATIDTYLEALTEAFLFYKVYRFDVRGKQNLTSEPKYYICDTGLRNVVLSTTNKDIGHLLENIVYLELLRRGYTINIGKVNRSEVDFVAVRNKQTEYFQVSASVLSEETLERELNGFKDIKDNYPKTLITMDDFEADHAGIKQVNVINWLMNK